MSAAVHSSEVWFLSASITQLDVLIHAIPTLGAITTTRTTKSVGFLVHTVLSTAVVSPA